MRFLFVAHSVVPIHGRSLEERPLGGTETALIRVAAELTQRGHDVTVVTSLPNPPLSNPLYISAQRFADVRDTDVLVSLRDWSPLLSPLKARLRLLWSGDAFDQPSTIGIGDRRITQRVDAYLAVSTWQADTLAEASGFPRERFWVIRNGVHLPLFAHDVLRHPKRLMYSSTPYRGLAHLERLFPLIRAKVPEAELVICSGLDVYADKAGAVPAGYQPVVAELAALKARLSTMAGVTFRGNLLQHELAQQFLQSAVLAYPNTFAETSCITALEAMAAGCVVVSTKLGALPETVGDAGVLIDGFPGTPNYDQTFVDSIAELLLSAESWRGYSQRAKERAQRTDWSEVVTRLLQFVDAALQPDR